MKVESAGLEVAGESEVVEVAEAAGDALGQLQQPVDGFHGAISQFGFHVGQGAIAMARA